MTPAQIWYWYGRSSEVVSMERYEDAMDALAVAQAQAKEGGKRLEEHMKGLRARMGLTPYTEED